MSWALGWLTHGRDRKDKPPAWLRSPEKLGWYLDRTHFNTWLNIISCWKVAESHNCSPPILGHLRRSQVSALVLHVCAEIKQLEFCSVH